MGASLAEELGAALDGVELPSGDAGAVDTGGVGEGGAESAAGESAAVDTGRDTQGRFVGKTGEPAGDQQQAQGDQAAAEAQAAAAQPTANADEQAAAAEASRSLAAPPATWSASAKAIYATLPEVARKEIAKREQDYARGIQQYAEKAKVADSFMREAQPYEAMLRAEGSDALGALKSFLTQAYALRTANPQERGRMIMQVAQQYGADLSQYLGQQGQTQAADGQTQDLTHVQQMVQQLVAPHLQRIQQWEQSQATAQQREQMQMEQEIQSQIEAFQNATNEDGTPKHLYYENVRGLMSAYFANGQAKDLEQAYDMACWANPEVRAALQADLQRSAEAQRLAEAKRKAQDAGRAGFNVSGQGGTGIAGATQTSLRDEIAAQLDAATGAGRV